jgi:cell wall assembly regulator SMI1
MTNPIKFKFEKFRAPEILVKKLIDYGGKNMPLRMTLYTIEYANKVVTAMKKLNFGTVFPRFTRDKKINKDGHSGWLMFADFNGDEYLAIDFNPGPAGKVGQVIWFCFEDDKYKWIADSFESYWETTGID